LSAKRTQLILILAGAAFGPLCAVEPIAAQVGDSTTSAAAHERLTRDDVDVLLRQARSAIQQGNLDQADALVKRAEDARAHYPFFHMGPTPTSVRRELNRARRVQPSSGQATTQGARNGLGLFGGARSADEGTTADPFLKREQFSEQQINSPSSYGEESMSPGMLHGDQSRMPTGGMQNLPAVPVAGQDMVNPFVPQNGGGPSPARYDAQSGNGYPIANTMWNQDGAAATGRPQADAELGGSMPSEDAPWTLPDAPLPRGMHYSQVVDDSSPELTPPRRSATTGYDRPASALDPSSRPQNSKQRVLSHLNAARSALEAGDIDLAENLTRTAGAMGVPESQFLPDEDRPSLVAWEIERARKRQGGAQLAAGRMPAAGRGYATQLAQASTENLPILAPAQRETPAADAAGGDRFAALPEPLALPPASGGATPGLGNTRVSPASDATALLEAGETALARHDRETALELFAQAHAKRGALAQADQQKLQDRLQMLAAEPTDTTVTPDDLASPAQQELGNVAPPAAITTDADPMPPSEISPPAEMSPPAASVPSNLESAPSNLEAAGENEQVLARQLSAEVGKRQSEAQRLLEEDPERAVTILREAQQLVNQSRLSESARRELLGRIDITLKRTESYISDHKAEIELDQRNEQVLNEVQRRRELNLKIQQKTAELVDEFNRLRDEQRYAEAEIIAKRLIELNPNDPVAQQVYQTAKFIRREMMNRSLADQREVSIWEQLNDTEESAINPVAENGKEVHYDGKTWEAFVKNRKGSRDRLERRTPRDLEIEQRLKTPVHLRYQETPLSEVVESLSQLTGVNIHLDPRGLSQEGYNSDTPITVNLNKEVSLKSALNLILEPLHLSYVIKDEVLKITSEQLRDGELITDTYNVADLVIPIPNFVPNSNIGLQGLIHDAHAAMGYGNGIGMAPAVLVNERAGQKGAAGNDQVLAQQFNAVPGAAGAGLSPATVPIGSGPGGMGGGANADFDSLIDLIVSTVSTDTWAENGGGEAEIRPFPTNLSLVISQTQAVHEEIADLLEQLRRLQDLQVTIEVRFIRLNDSFFERIGIDFDMNIEDRTIGTADLVPGQVFEPGRQSATVGLLPPAGTNVFPNFTTDLDIPFRQDSFNLTQLVPFGGPVAGGANFGFAILSDIEAYFLIEAAQGDRRTNVLNAPKVTLFNGQQAFVADAVSQPFVIGVIPVVGEFVAAQQPVIVVLNEGTMMTIQAVVSDDRRYVRLTVVPFFTQVGDVQEFTFEGSSSSSSSTSSTDDDDDGKNESEEDSEEETRTGVTVQLPAFQFISVVTTVSVPDGGTVLLGGIKRLSEGRNEFGVPLLSKVPYINRLFKNVAIGRETDSLMMMVTPRIIIQEEEEERLGIPVP
jgi:general secretion pathway protein D